MKKIAIGILIALVAASPAVAAKKKHHAAAAAAASADPNDAGKRFVWDSLQLYTPTVWKMWYYSKSENRK